MENLSHYTLHEEDEEEKVVGTTGNEIPAPEMDSKEVTSDAIDEESEKSKHLAEVMLQYYQHNEGEEEDEDEEEEEDDEEEDDEDNPDLAGLSHLDPDPSLGCLPRRDPRQRSTTWSYVAPEEPPQEKAWKYLTKRNIVHLLEKITYEIFLHRFSSPIDFMIDAIEKARLKKQEEDEKKERRRSKKKRVGGSDGDSVATSGTFSPDDDDDKDKSGATADSGLVLFPSEEDYIDDVILVPPQDDVNATRGDTTDDVTSFGGKLDVGSKEKADDRDRWSTVTIVSENIHDDDDVDKVTCFPQVALDFETEVDEEDVGSVADNNDNDDDDDDDDDQSPRVVTSTEALKLMSFLS